jgi:hypothetical protein
MATKACRRQARELVEALEVRAHAGPPVDPAEIHSAREFLRRHDFPATSDYFHRLGQIQDRVLTRPAGGPGAKRNYGGEAGGWWMQLQSVYDHVILSTCHAGEFNTQRGRIKLSHRFNAAGRVDFVELKFLRSLQPRLDGEIRKLLLVKAYSHLPNDWREAEAFALQVLPRELVFLHPNVFRHPRHDILAWAINLGHWTAANLLNELRAHRVNGCARASAGPPGQFALKDVASDAVALPILEQAAALEAAVQAETPDSVIVRYLTK